MYGFWTVGFKNRDVKNPYIFLEKVSQVFFINDSRDPNVKVVLRQDPRGRRTTQEHDVPFFGAPGSLDSVLTIPPFNHGHGIALVIPRQGVPQEVGGVDGVVVRGEAIEVVDANARVPNEDAHYDDVDHEDDTDLAFGNVLAGPI
jgi:hypothetical protein